MAKRGPKAHWGKTCSCRLFFFFREQGEARLSDEKRACMRRMADTTSTRMCVDETAGLNVRQPCVMCVGMYVCTPSQ